MFIVTRTLVTYARNIFKSQLSKYAHASGVYLHCA